MTKIIEFRLLTTKERVVTNVSTSRQISTHILVKLNQPRKLTAESGTLWLGIIPIFSKMSSWLKETIKKRF